MTESAASVVARIAGRANVKCVACYLASRELPVHMVTQLKIGGEKKREIISDVHCVTCYFRISESYWGT
jgi:hypothetical protein